MPAAAAATKQQQQVPRRRRVELNPARGGIVLIYQVTALRSGLPPSLLQLAFVTTST